MKIIILGASQVGTTLAENLASENNDITLIDPDSLKLRKLENRLDIRTVQGLGSHPDVLHNAQANEADMIIAVTDNDEVNMIACQVAYCLFKTPKKIARIRSRSYLKQKNLFADDLLPVDVRINPEMVLTNQLVRLLERPGALQVVDFAGGKVQMVALKTLLGGELIGKTVSVISDHLEGLNAHVAAIFRGGLPVSLDEEFTTIQMGDEVYFITETSEVKKVMSALGRIEKPNRSIMIAGGGRVGSLLAESIEDDYNVKVIERDVHVCRKLTMDLNSTIVLHGDATDQDILVSENIDHVDVFCALTSDDEDNIMSCLLAKRLGVKKVIALVQRQAYADLLTNQSIDVILSPQSATVSSILAHLRQGDIVNVSSLRNGAAEVIEIIVHGDKKSSRIVGRSLSEINLPDQVRICSVVRKNKALFPVPELTIKEDDHIIAFVGNKKSVREVEKLFQVRVTFI